MAEPIRDEQSPGTAASGQHTSLSLLERVRGNDASAWHRLVHLYSPLMYYWCRRASVGPPDAEDVLQEAFRVAAARLNDFRRDRPGDTFRGWLRAITRNVLLAHLRHAARQPRAAGGSDAWMQLQSVSDSTPVPSEDDPPIELHGLYCRALELVRGEFEERSWQAFWRVTVDGRPPADVGQELGMSAASVRQAKSRILRRLKAEVGDLAD